MADKPNPVLHMMKWGAGSGFILALLYMILVLSSSSIGGGLAVLANPFFWMLAVMYGVIPGLIMGFFIGFMLRSLLLTVPIPFTKADMQSKRVEVYGWTFVLTLFMSLMMIFFFFGSLSEWLLLGTPALIAASASTYAAHRYMYRLRLWSASIDTRKSKIKNDDYSHLIEQDEDENYFHDERPAEKQDTRS